MAIEKRIVLKCEHDSELTLTAKIEGDCIVFVTQDEGGMVANGDPIEVHVNGEEARAFAEYLLEIAA
jgi:hypothetical protein